MSLDGRAEQRTPPNDAQPIDPNGAPVALDRIVSPLPKQQHPNPTLVVIPPIAGDASLRPPHSPLIWHLSQRNARNPFALTNRNLQLLVGQLLAIAARNSNLIDASPTNRRRGRQMERKLKLIFDGTNQHVSQQINEQTLKLAQSIKSILTNITRQSQTDPDEHRRSTQPDQMMAPNDENNNQRELVKTANEFDWPGSFIQLLDTLTLKQQQQCRSPAANSKPPRDTSISPVSSLAIDDRDFELIAIPSTVCDTKNNADAIELTGETVPKSTWLTELIVPDDATKPDAFPVCSPSPLIKFDDVNGYNENNDRNIINLMKFLCKKSNSEPAFSPHQRNTQTRDEINSNAATTSLPVGSKLTLNCKHKRPRSQTLPVRFDRITIVDLNQLKRFDCDLPSLNVNADRPASPATSPPNSQSISTRESILIKQDFDDENDDQASQATSSRHEATADGDLQQQNRRGDPADGSKYSTLTGSNRLSSSGSADAQTLRSSGAASSVKDDGKYSMLQFALYNFREAIEKYSLESRTSLRNAGGAAGKSAARNSQALGDSHAGDCSTLRGSLKMIESMRNSNSAAPEDRQPGGQQMASGGKQEWTWRELAEMVKFTRAPLKRPLLRLDESAELERRAVDCFAAVMRYMGDLPPATTIQVNSIGGAGGGATGKPVKLTIPESDVECVYLILINCHNYVKLRDELYCQLIKQTTNNRSEQPESCLRGWRLLSLLAAYFDCSAHFRPYLINYLEQNAFDKRRAYHSLALLCLQNLRKTFKFGGRKNVPLIEEIAALSAGRISKRQIYRLPGGTERVINTKSTTVVDDIIREICSSMLMVEEESEMFEFSLYCIADGHLYTMPLNRDEYILDITTELIKNHQQYFLIFCRSIWHYPLRLDSKLYIELTFNQIAPDYLEGLLLVLPAGSISTGSRPRLAGARGAQLPAPAAAPLHLKSKLLREIARLAALLHRASGTEHQPQRNEVKYLLPKPIVRLIKQQQRALAKKAAGSSEHYASGVQPLIPSATAPTQQQLVELVLELWREMSAFEPLDAKAQFLDVVRHWPLFGSSFFAIKLIQRDLIQPTDFILALNKFGIQMLEPQTHETRQKYSFNEVISTRKVRSEDGALFLDMKCGNLMKRTIIRIQTDQAHEISRLIRQYIDIELMQANSDKISCDKLVTEHLHEAEPADIAADT